MISELSLEIPETRNVKTLRITDGSHYNPKIKVECGILEITPPGVNISVNFNVSKGFSTLFNSSNLKISKVKQYSKLQALPDGVYHVKYSIKPNEELWVEYDYLRTDKIIRDYNEQLCKLKLQACEPSKEINRRIKYLREIRIYIEAAKVEVEECHNTFRGMELYNYAQTLLNKFKTTDCLTC